MNSCFIRFSEGYVACSVGEVYDSVMDIIVGAFIVFQYPMSHPGYVITGVTHPTRDAAADTKI